MIEVRERERQTDRQTDRQTVRQTEKETQRERERERERERKKETDRRTEKETESERENPNRKTKTPHLKDNLVILKNPKRLLVCRYSTIQGLIRNRHTTVSQRDKKKGSNTTIELKYKRFAFYFGFFSTEMRNRGRVTKVLHKVA